MRNTARAHFAQHMWIAVLALAVCPLPTHGEAEKSEKQDPSEEMRMPWLRLAEPAGHMTTQLDARGGCDGVKNGGTGFHTDNDKGACGRWTWGKRASWGASWSTIAP